MQEIVAATPRQISDGVVFSADLCMLIQEYFPHRPTYVGFTQSKLAEMLSGFDIAPEDRGKRRGSQVLRYYRRSAFDEWFRRYRSPIPMMLPQASRCSSRKRSTRIRIRQTVAV